MNNGKKIGATGVLSLALLLSMAPSTGVLAASLSAASGTVVATGLASPRGISMGSDGNLYIAESGTGGDQTITVGEGEQATQVTLGLTGRITKVSANGTKSVVAANLPSSSAPEGEASGPQGVVYANGALWVTTTGAQIGVTPRPMEGSLLKVDPQTGTVQSVANIQQYENTSNPGGFAQDSNPYGLAAGRDGMVYVADAAGNTLYKVDPSNGQITPVTVFKGLPLPSELAGQGPFAQGNPERGGAQEIDPVPTGVTVGPNGDVYVGLLSGFPFLEGLTKVERVAADGSVSDAARGLTMVVDVEYGPDGAMYVSEFGKFSLEGNPPGFAPNSGQVVRVKSDGTNEVVASGLNEPNGISFDARGNLYVAVNSTSRDNGQVLRFDGVGDELSGVVVGMPRTGGNFLTEFGYIGSLALVLLAAGASLLVVSRRASARQR